MSQAKQNKALDLTCGSPMKLLIRFAIPMLIGSIFQLCYNMVDTIVLGKFVSPEALASVGATTSTSMMVNMASGAVTNAITILISQAWGAKDAARVRRTVGQSMLLSVSWSLLLGLIAFVGARPLMTLLGTPANIIEGSIAYITITCGINIALTMYNATAQILRAIGDSRTPLYFLILCSMLNVVLDLAFVLFLDGGVAGVAWATVISQIVSAVLCLIYMWKKYPQLRFGASDMRLDRKMMTALGKLAGPMLLQNMSLSIGMLVITSVINSFGSDIVAAYTVGGKVEQIVVITFSQVAFSFSVFSGQNFGAKKYDRIGEGMLAATKLILAAVAFSMTVMLIFAPQLATIFVDKSNTAILAGAVQMVRVEACFLWALGLIWLVNSCLRGMGHIKPTFISSIVELVSKIGLSILFSSLFGSIGIWFAAPIGWVLGLIPGTYYYFRSGWKQKAIEADKKAAQAA